MHLAKPRNLEAKYKARTLKTKAKDMIVFILEDPIPALAMLDLSGAFDTLDHEILLSAHPTTRTRPW
jgi:hypothetical protein